jgi:hypothetical protein
MQPVDVTARLDMTPYRVLSMNIDPGLQAVREAADRNLALRNWRLQNATEFAQKQALQEWEIQSNKDIAQWHEKVANIREDTMNNVWDKRIQAQAAAAASAEKKRIEALNEEELNREARTYATGQVDQKTGLFIPPIPRIANESTQDYVTRAATERAKLSAQHEGLIQKNTALLSGRINKMVQDNEAQNQSAAHAAGVGGINELLSRLNTGQQQTFRAALQKLTSAGLPYTQALSQVERLNPIFTGAADAYNEKFAPTLVGARALKNPMLETHLESLGGLLKNPAALSRSDFGDLLDEHPSQVKTSASFSLTSSGSAPPSVSAPAITPANVIALTGIPSLDRQVQVEQSQNRINDLTKQRAALMAQILGLNNGIKTAVVNPNIVIPGAGGGMGAMMPQTTPAYRDATSRAKAVLGFQSELAPMEQQLTDVNEKLGGEFQ